MLLNFSSDMQLLFSNQNKQIRERLPRVVAPKSQSCSIGAESCVLHFELVSQRL